MTIKRYESPYGKANFLSTHSVANKHLRALGINRQSGLLQKCVTLEDLKRIAKQQHRKLIPALHPDTKNQHKRLGNRIHSRTFQSVQNAFEWIMDLTEEECVRFYKQVYTLPTIPLPWGWSVFERHPALIPDGFHEDLEWLWYR